MSAATTPSNTHAIIAPNVPNNYRLQLTDTIRAGD